MRQQILAAALALVALATPAAAQISPDQVATIAKRIHDTEGWRLGSSSSRETRNKFWALVIGVVHHGHPVYNPTPDPSWCLKDGGNGRPQTDDVATKCATREYWDCIGGVGGDGYENQFRCNPHPGDRLPPEQNVYPPPVPHVITVSTPPPAPPQTGEAWTPAHQALRERLGSGATTQTIAEQLAYSFPSESWGLKRAAAGRPISFDVIARQNGSQLIGVRVLPATTGPPFDITGQVFETVSAVNHVGAEPPAPVPPTPEPPPLEPPTPPALPGVDELRALLATMAAEIAQLRADVAAQRQEVIDAVKGQSYDIRASSRVFGVLTGEITPKRAPQ